MDAEVARAMGWTRLEHHGRPGHREKIVKDGKEFLGPLSEKATHDCLESPDGSVRLYFCCGGHSGYSWEDNERLPYYSTSPEGLSLMLEWAAGKGLDIILRVMPDGCHAGIALSKSGPLVHGAGGPTPGLALARALCAWKEGAK